MARLKNIATGAVVNVPDEKAERLGAEWEPVKDAAPAKKPAAKPTKK